ncbi:MAG TPA: hypothetical protein ACFYDZ_08955 [Candidatus Brocadiaceae bacterium]
MSEQKNTSVVGQPSKKPASTLKPSANKAKKEQSKTEPPAKINVNAVPEILLSKKIDELLDEVSNKPLISVEKKERAKLIQAYEKLIFKMVREINCVRK